MRADQKHPDFVPPNFTLVQKLGSGQTSHVYLAGHPRLGEVALKLPRPELQSQPVLRRMFENEVQITLSLRHPNIVRAFEGYPTGPKAYLALEYCSGGTLDQRLLEAGRMPLTRALTFIADVGRGLQHSHDRSVLHRDVKPANVFVDADGRAKLGDFGTGVFMAEDNSDRVGTAFYMAPEIFEGARATVRSDVYSLGVLAYEVLTGSRPFRGDSYEALMMAHLSGLPRDPRSDRADVSRTLSRVVLKAISRDAEKRYPRVDELLEALLEQLDEPLAPPAPRTGRASRTQHGRRPHGNGDGGAAEDGEGEARGKRSGLFGWLRRKKS